MEQMMPWKTGQSGNPAGRPSQYAKAVSVLRAAEMRFSSLTREENANLTAHDFLRMIYRDPAAPADVRLQCILAAIPFEKPRLTATAIITETNTSLPARMERAQRRMMGLDVIDGVVCPPEESRGTEAMSEVGSLQPNTIDASIEGGENLRLEDFI
jgi:hypothetical protein